MAAVAPLPEYHQKLLDFEALIAGTVDSPEPKRVPVVASSNCNAADSCPREGHMAQLTTLAEASELDVSDRVLTPETQIINEVSCGTQMTDPLPSTTNMEPAARPETAEEGTCKVLAQMQAEIASINWSLSVGTDQNLNDRYRMPMLATSGSRWTSRMQSPDRASPHRRRPRSAPPSKAPGSPGSPNSVTQSVVKYPRSRLDRVSCPSPTLRYTRSLERRVDLSFMPRDSGFVPSLGSITRPGLRDGKTFVPTMQHHGPPQGIFLEDYNGVPNWPSMLRPALRQPWRADESMPQNDQRLGVDSDVLFLERGGSVKTLDQVTRPGLAKGNTFTPSVFHVNVHPKAQASFLHETGDFSIKAAHTFRPGLSHGAGLLHSAPEPRSPTFLGESMPVPPLGDLLREGVTQGSTFMYTEAHDQQYPEHIQDSNGFAEHLRDFCRPALKVGSTFVPSTVHVQPWESSFSPKGETSADLSCTPRDSGLVPCLGSITRSGLSHGRTFMSTMQSDGPPQGIFLEEYNGVPNWPNMLRPELNQHVQTDVSALQNVQQTGADGDNLFLEESSGAISLEQITRPGLAKGGTFMPSLVHDTVHSKAQAPFLEETGDFSSKEASVFRPGLAHGPGLLHSAPEPRSPTFLGESMSVPPLGDLLREGVTEGSTFMYTEAHDQQPPEHIQDFSGFAEHLGNSCRPGLNVGSTFMPSIVAVQPWESPFSAEVQLRACSQHQHSLQQIGSIYGEVDPAVNQ